MPPSMPRTVSWACVTSWACDEVEGVACGGDRGGVDAPAAVCGAAGVEAVGEVRGEVEAVGVGTVGGVRLGGEHLFVGELGEEFRE